MVERELRGTSDEMLRGSEVLCIQNILWRKNHFFNETYKPIFHFLILLHSVMCLLGSCPVLNDGFPIHHEVQLGHTHLDPFTCISSGVLEHKWQAS